jgi:hypothetical protein
VVSGESQVPEWINREEVNIVLHKDIIPESLLPTFNCNPIEMHLHNIADLDEEYLYFNDDIFPLKECKPTDFFREGRGVLGMSHHLFVFDMFKQICRNSDSTARRALGMRTSHLFLRPQHVCTPMIKSECETFYAKMEKELLATITTTRMGNNVSQYVYLDYMYLNGTLENRRMSKRHFSLGITSADKLRQFIANPDRKFTCINDVQLSYERFVELRDVLIAAFEARFPNRSKYENEQ